ncbi:hypothetical protein RZQ51_00005, partial [Klebsiella quasipneumoniae subsp. similipneumoniae]
RIGSFMPEKVTSLNGLKVTLEYGSYTAGAGNSHYVKSGHFLTNYPIRHEYQKKPENSHHGEENRTSRHGGFVR